MITRREKLFFIPLASNIKKEIKRSSSSTRYWKFYVKSNVVSLITFFLARINFDNYEKLSIALISYLLRMKYYMLWEHGKYDK